MNRTHSPLGMPRAKPGVHTQRTLGFVFGAFLIFATAVAIGTTRDSSFEATLPNPMGGIARTAPGTATGAIELAGLAIADAAIHMGDVGLDVTYVPQWEVTNPSKAAVTLVVNQPQVLEGCCPGPVYAGGELTHPGQAFTIAPGDRLLLQFPLQMHAGMDGQHHLVLPLESGSEQADLTVTGNFTASAPA